MTNTIRPIEDILQDCEFKGISRRKLSIASGVAYSTLWRLAHEENLPNYKTLVRLEVALKELTDQRPQ